MSNAKSAVSFDEIIQADRQRRKNEELANEIFGRSRKAKDSSKDLDRKQSRTPSLASRVGVAKRSNSSTNVKSSSFNASSFNPPSRPSSATANIARTNRLATAVNNRQQANIPTGPTPRGAGLSIKGAAGRFTLEASNFAPGTTVPDIEAALKAIVTETNTPIEILSCRFTSTSPMIIAEITFPEKPMADAVIKTFNGLLADGRILRIEHKPSNPRPSEPLFISDPLPTLSQPKDLFDAAPNPSHSLTEPPPEDTDMEMATDHEPPAYTSERDRSDRERRDRDRDRDREPPRHDGEDDHRNGSRRDERDRDRDQDRDRDGNRNREHDHPRDRDRNRDHNSRRYDDRPRYERRDDSRGGPRGGYGVSDQRGGGGRPYGGGMGFPRDGGYNDGNGMMGSPRGGGFRGGGGYRGRGGFGRGF